MRWLKEAAVNQFKQHALKQLTDQQVRFAPPPRRLEQLSRAEQLLAEVDADKSYPYQYVCFRITDYRPDSFPDLPGSGADLKHDLSQFITERAPAITPRPAAQLPEPA